ncbi:MAG: hypothetical protein IPI48_17605 [bacterium]|nr:hypothetical protein [bacterium]
MRARRVAVAVCLIGLVVMAGGCGETFPVTPPDDPPSTGLPFPDTADKLMANVMSTYETMDYDEFLHLLHPDCVTILQPSTVALFPSLGPTLDVTEERRIHERLFSKNNVTDPNGALVPGVQSIAFQTFARQGTWGTSSGTDPIPDTWCALYDVVVFFDHGALYSTSKVQGTIKFYVTARDSIVGGVTKPYFQMRGQLDLTQDMKAGLATESSSWGEVKARYR